jgi:pantoate kinase
MVKHARAYAPGHITGFVEFPYVRFSDYLHMGSRGAGVCIDKGVTTDVWIDKSSANKVSVQINGNYVKNADVSLYVVNEYLHSLVNPVYIKVNHKTDIPIGYGLGSSGAAALSLSYALNEALGLGLSKEEAARIAHKADIACKCGAGTVIAEYYGGFELRLSAGAPGIGVVKSIPLHGYKVIALCMNPYPTKEFLTSKMNLINGLGGKMLNKLLKSLSVNDFMDMSLTFVKSIDFINAHTARIIDELIDHGYKASVALFGDTVFSIVKEEDVKDVTSILCKYRRGDDSRLLVCNVDNIGARVIV